MHAVFDGVGKDTFEQSLACLRKRGVCVLFGAASGQVPRAQCVHASQFFADLFSAGAHRPQPPYPGQPVPDATVAVSSVILSWHCAEAACAAPSIPRRSSCNQIRLHRRRRTVQHCCSRCRAVFAHGSGQNAAENRSHSASGQRRGRAQRAAGAPHHGQNSAASAAVRASLVLLDNAARGEHNVATDAVDSAGRKVRI